MTKAFLLTLALTLLLVTVVLGQDDLHVQERQLEDLTEDHNFEDELRSAADQMLPGSNSSRKLTCVEKSNKKKNCTVRGGTCKAACPEQKSKRLCEGGCSCCLPCKDTKRCMKNGGKCMAKNMTCAGEKADKYCKGGCTCCLPVETKMVCNEWGGFCAAKTGNYCSGEVYHLQNSCNDICSCCVQDDVCRPACKNGGRCLEPNNCTCTGPWTGTTCEMPVCDPTCMNGGTCSAPNTCNCTDSWVGPTCETPVCDSTCMNGGTCSAPNKCNCTDSWVGPTCEAECFVGDGEFFFGNQCFKDFQIEKTWTEAEQYCIDQGLKLGQPADVKGMHRYLTKDGILQKRTWIGGRGTGSDICWLNGTCIPGSSPLWGWSPSTSEGFGLSIRTSTETNKPLAAEAIVKLRYILCERKV